MKKILATYQNLPLNKLAWEKEIHQGSKKTNENFFGYLNSRFMDYAEVKKAYNEYVTKHIATLKPLDFNSWKQDVRMIMNKPCTNEEFFQKRFEKQATFRGNGVYEFGGIFHTDTGILAKKGIKMMYAHYLDDLKRGSLTRV